MTVIAVLCIGVAGLLSAAVGMLLWFDYGIVDLGYRGKRDEDKKVEQDAEYSVSVMVDKEGEIIVKLYDEVSERLYLFVPENGLEYKIIRDIKNTLKRTKKGGGE